MSDKSPDAFRTISEVADWLGVQPHVLRFWESKFSQVKPVKRAGGRRYYRPGDMLLLGGIRKLLHEDGLTIKGAQKVLREDGMAYVSRLSQPVDDDDGPYEEAPSAQSAEGPVDQPDVSEVVAFEQKPDPEPMQDDRFAALTDDPVVEDQPLLPLDPEPVEAQPEDSPAPAFETAAQDAPTPQIEDVPHVETSLAEAPHTEPPHVEPQHVEAAPQESLPEEIAPVAAATEHTEEPQIEEPQPQIDEPEAEETPLPSFLTEPTPEPVEPEPEIVEEQSASLPSFMQGDAPETIEPETPPTHEMGDAEMDGAAIDGAVDQPLEPAPVESTHETTVEPAAFTPSKPADDTTIEPAEAFAPEVAEHVDTPSPEIAETSIPALDAAPETAAEPKETAPIDPVDHPEGETNNEEALVAEAQPVPRIVDAPDPDESAYVVESSAMSAAFSLQATSADMISEVTPLIAQLAALRDRMAAQRGR